MKHDPPIIFDYLFYHSLDTLSKNAKGIVIFSRAQRITLTRSKCLTILQPVWGDNKVAEFTWRCIKTHKTHFQDSSAQVQGPFTASMGDKPACACVCPVSGDNDTALRQTRENKSVFTARTYDSMLLGRSEALEDDPFWFTFH